jgi:hypothetical protein
MLNSISFFLIFIFKTCTPDERTETRLFVPNELGTKIHFSLDEESEEGSLVEEYKN